MSVIYEILGYLNLADVQQLRDYVLARHAFLAPWFEFKACLLDKEPDRAGADANLPSLDDAFFEALRGVYVDYNPRTALAQSSAQLCLAIHHRLYTNVFRGLLGEGECYFGNKALESKDLLDGIMKLVTILKDEHFAPSHGELTAFMHERALSLGIKVNHETSEDRITQVTRLKNSVTQTNSLGIRAEERSKNFDIILATLSNIAAQITAHDAMRSHGLYRDAVRSHLVLLKDTYNHILHCLLQTPGVEHSNLASGGFAFYPIRAEDRMSSWELLVRQIAELEMRLSRGLVTDERAKVQLIKAKQAANKWIENLELSWGGNLPAHLIENGYVKYEIEEESMVSSQPEMTATRSNFSL
jgi:hypothetical protein